MVFLGLDDDLSGDQRFGDLSRIELLVPPGDEWRANLCQRPIGSPESALDVDLSGPEWAEKYFPERLGHGWCQAHLDIWEWAGRVTAYHTPEALAINMPRGFGKSTTLELVTAW